MLCKKKSDKKIEDRVCANNDLEYSFSLEYIKEQMKFNKAIYALVDELCVESAMKRNPCGEAIVEINDLEEIFKKLKTALKKEGL